MFCLATAFVIEVPIQARYAGSVEHRAKFLPSIIRREQFFDARMVGRPGRKVAFDPQWGLTSPSGLQSATTVNFARMPARPSQPTMHAVESLDPDTTLLEA
ncbi:hypothetical protein PAXINDRAFT_104157 [Paxillus involutus ATCC 200175]|uniref:Uncharacterized protein n=1 Tax=Paxillus involutus ATCC 200175 TaxID=664439 RepID=A0A0C9T8B3_PAXIN|nr:hypothetical protein PAXINDRAFT_104157 [Paxillus involutus ATCC 200175]